MKTKVRILLLFAIALTAVGKSFGQSENAVFSQKPAATETMVGKAVRACFGGNAGNAKVFAVVNRADWCTICQKNTERVEAILPRYKSKPILFIANDLTDDQSRKASDKYLKKLHIGQDVAPVTESGVMILLNAKSHALITKVSLASSDEEIERAINQALKSI